MKKTLFGLLLGGSTLLMAMPAFAADQGLYAEVGAGLALLRDSDLTDSTAPGFVLETDFDNGYLVNAALGTKFGAARVEGEISYQKNDFDSASIAGIPGSAALSGDVSSLAFLMNGYFHFGGNATFSPFITAGLGAAKVEVNDLTVVGSVLPPVSDDDTVFAYQLGAGVDLKLNDAVTVDFKYRYFATSDPELFITGKAEISSHNLMAGVRCTF